MLLVPFCRETVAVSELYLVAADSVSRLSLDSSLLATLARLDLTISATKHCAIHL